MGLMDTEALAEWEFWETLSDEDRALNTEGDPPYMAGLIGAELTARLMYDIPDGPVLDLGCGTGRLTVEVSSRVPEREFFAVDISQRMLDVVESRHLPNVSTFLGDGRSLPDFGSIAGAFSVAMFQHIPHDAQASYIRQVAARLRPYGGFAFTIAVGEVDEFLNHQAQAHDWVGWIYGAGLVVRDEVTDERGWHWVVAVNG